MKGAPPNLIKWIGESWWQDFTVNHPKGELATYKWPRKPDTKGAKTFITLPFVGNEKARKVVIKDGKKRVAEMSSSDMRKAGFFEKVKKNSIGKRGKVSEARPRRHAGQAPASRRPGNGRALRLPRPCALLPRLRDHVRRGAQEVGPRTP